MRGPSPLDVDDLDRMNDEHAVLARRDAFLREGARSSDWVQLGAAAFVLKLPLDVTLDALERALQDRADDPAARFWRARALYFERLDLDGARRDLTRMLAVDPAAPHGWALLAGVQRDAAEPPAAVLATCERAWELAPCWLSNTHAVCDAALRVGRRDIARSRFDAGLRAFDESGIRDLLPRDAVDAYCLDVLVGRDRAAVVDLLGDLAGPH